MSGFSNGRIIVFDLFGGNQMQKQMGDPVRKVGDEGKDSRAKDWEGWEGAQSTGILLILFVSGEKIARLFMLSMKEESALVYKGEAVVCGRMSVTGILQSLRSLERRFCVVIWKELPCAVGLGSVALDTCGQSSVR